MEYDYAYKNLGRPAAQIDMVLDTDTYNEIDEYEMLPQNFILIWKREKPEVFTHKSS